MKSLTLFVLLYLTSLSFQARFQLTDRFLTTNRWTLSITDFPIIHEDVYLDSNGVIYRSDNRTQFQGASWNFDERTQFLQIHRNQEGSCLMNTIVINQNPTYYPDVSIFGVGYVETMRVTTHCSLQVVTNRWQLYNECRCNQPKSYLLPRRFYIWSRIRRNYDGNDSLQPASSD